MPSRSTFQILLDMYQHTPNTCYILDDLQFGNGISISTFRYGELSTLTNNIKTNCSMQKMAYMNRCLCPSLYLAGKAKAMIQIYK